MNDFLGDKILLEKYTEVTQDLKISYQQGISLAFAGSHGLGKTLVSTNILKRAVEKGYSGLYVTLNDIIACTINSISEDRGLARRALLTVDFLVIDEVDPRHIGSDQAADLFGRILEDIFRTRAQNKMPIFMCTNSPKIIDSFTGPIKQSIESLMNYVKIVTVLGKDYRKIEKTIVSKI
jgi:DNA replication protein DnaC